MTSPSSEEIEHIAEEAYIYAFPMLMGYRFAFATFLTPGLPSYRGPANAIHGRPTTLDHTFREVITPNADTPYSFGLLDLRAEPVVLQVPAVADRYYVLQFVDLFGTNPHFIGSRATGTAPGTFLAVGPGWDRDAATAASFDAVLPFDTELVFVIGRTQLLGADDVPSLARVMAGYGARPLSRFREEAPVPVPPEAWPVWDDAASRDDRFIGYLNFLLSFCQPIPPSEEGLMARFARIGIGVGAPFASDDLDDRARRAIRAGVARAREKMEVGARTAGDPIHGWVIADVFGDREWYGGDYLLRAAAAMAGWGGNDSAEALYPAAREDGDGRPLAGAHRYQVRFRSLPPCKAFWSVTLYDTSYDGTAGYLVDNPIHRYLINSTTQGLVYGEDGSLAITIQHEQPGDTVGRANWLPAPEGPFYLVLRIYWPEPAALDRSWTPPPIVRLD